MERLYADFASLLSTVTKYLPIISVISKSFITFHRTFDRTYNLCFNCDYLMHAFITLLMAVADFSIISVSQSNIL